MVTQLFVKKLRVYNFPFSKIQITRDETRVLKFQIPVPTINKRTLKASVSNNPRAF